LDEGKRLIVVFSKRLGQGGVGTGLLSQMNVEMEGLGKNNKGNVIKCCQLIKQDLLLLVQQITQRKFQLQSYHVLHSRSL
jgi:hypothetical protein